MYSEFDPDSKPKDEAWIVWVLYPEIKTEDPELLYYYDFSQSYQEYQAVFGELGIPWKWQGVSMENHNEVISGLAEQSLPGKAIVLNLCDGDEANGVPGPSVIAALEKQGLCYTGADEIFYRNTNSKIPMKKLFEQYGVPTPPWREVNPDGSNAASIFANLCPPLIVKPAVSAGSLGIGIRSVVHSAEELRAYLLSGNRYYKNWDLFRDGVFVEEFIDGPEYTSFILGSHRIPETCIVYTPVERHFESSLPNEEKFLSFDRLWEFYDKELPLEGDKFLWNYCSVDGATSEELATLSRRAYAAVGGEGYARIDFRRNASTGQLYVLEVNAQCGLSDDENYTSIGAILRFGGQRYSELILEILQQALRKEPFPAKMLL
ncbi:MAG: D-alanine--D-alanine ligase [Saprospiraceae bacterium]|nr:D-alanine--D-alanine ligase [Saprospiraceae bacterium]